MAYAFTGIFSNAPEADPAALPQGHIFRQVTRPFTGCGILAPGLTASFPDCIAYLDRLGIAGSDWVFLDYQTWAGPIERVIGIGQRDGVAFGPIRGDGAEGETAFLAVLDAFGLPEPASVYFAPFERGFWDSV